MYNDPKPLERWRIAKVRRRASDTVWAAHAYAYSIMEDAGFVTPEIIRYNDKTMTISTKGGDRYILTGEPGNSRDASAAWLKFLERQRITDVVDVSSRYLPKKGRAA